jgi:hypothetical protein
MKSNRTRKEEGQYKRWRHDKRWTGGGAAGQEVVVQQEAEVAEDKRQHNSQPGQMRGMRARTDTRQEATMA